MSKYQKINVLFGWLSFAIAAAVYLLTIEPTVSFWDCGEFITAAHKLEIGHPPGAPFFMILARCFSMLGGDVANVALMINAMSALASAFTILFLFWSITHLAKKLVSNNGQADHIQTWKIMASGFIGAMAFTFSDTFWFSAVEGEVYATSSLFTAVVFWCILKWENEADKAYANRWIILIAYLMGLSIGVHLLNLLAIPAIVMVYYFKNYTPSRIGILKALGVAVLLLGSVMYGIIPGVIQLAFLFDLFFVDVVGLPFNVGLIIFILALISGLVFGISYTLKKQKVLANTILTALAVVLIGYSSYSVIMIRSNADPGLDQNNPEDLQILLSYLNREQYGSRPLVYGAYFNAPLNNKKPYVKDKNVYIKKDGKYVLSYEKQKRNYSSSHKSLFPRMYTEGASGQNKKEYEKWAGIKANQKEKPSFAQNLRFFFSYQVNYMYIRYFMWNFAGRQSDHKSIGGKIKGNWISGIPFVDNLRLGDQSLRSDHMKNNKAHNKYYFLPLLLGIAGLLYQYKKSTSGKHDFFIIMLLFVFTGIAIVVYLNQPPLQPRERDYAYAGSFYAFAIWIGLGFLAILEQSKKLIKSEAVALPVIFVICFVAVPGLMAQQNWDDHDRSNRYLARDMAYNYLNSCEPNAILFTLGDNDTFPLWYLQEVEGVRTDVRVCNLSYLATDWYIDQMKQQNYDSPPLPISMEKSKYIEGTRDVVYVVDDPRFKAYVDRNNGLDLKEALEYVLSDKKNTKTVLGHSEKLDHFPARKFTMDVDKAQVLKTKTVSKQDSSLIVERLEWEIEGNYVDKGGLAVFNMLLENNWERPIYFAVTVSRKSYLGLEKYFQLEGLAYRLVPIKTVRKDQQIGRVNTSGMYANMMEDFKWGNSGHPDVYLDETCSGMVTIMRTNYVRLAAALLEEQKTDLAIKSLNQCIQLVSNEKQAFDYWGVLMAEIYYKAGEVEKANQMLEMILERVIQELNYYADLKPVATSEFLDSRTRALFLMQEIYRLTSLHEKGDLFKRVERIFQGQV